MTTYLHRIIGSDDPLVSPYAEDELLAWLEREEWIDAVDDALEDARWLPSPHLPPHAG